jgi:hypothetical protein
VIVAYGNQIAMEETLDASLQAIFGRRPDGAAPWAAGGRPSGLPPRSGLGALVSRAWEAWARAQEALRRGDWAGYGEAQRRLEEALRDLRERAGR